MRNPPSRAKRGATTPRPEKDGLTPGAKWIEEQRGANEGTTMSDDSVQARYELAVRQTRAGLQALFELREDLERADTHPSLRASLLTLTHDLAAVQPREAAPPPRFEEGAAAPRRELRISPHVEAGEEATVPEAGG